MNWLLVFLGGGIGSIIRFGLGKLSVATSLPLPLSTFMANVLASLILGLVWFSPLLRADRSWVIPLVGVGLCGGLSTFSTFSLETFQLFRDGHWYYAVANVVFSTAVCLAVVYLASRNAID